MAVPTFVLAQERPVPTAADPEREGDDNV